MEVGRDRRRFKKGSSLAGSERLESSNSHVFIQSVHFMRSLIQMELW